VKFLEWKRQKPPIEGLKAEKPPLRAKANGGGESSPNHKITVHQPLLVERRGEALQKNKFARDSGADEQNKTRSPYRPHKREGWRFATHIFAQSKGKRERRINSLHIQSTVFVTIKT
jgi:hypothetical protein